MLRERMRKDWTILSIFILLTGYAAFSCSGMSKYTAEQKIEFEQAMAQLDTPEKANTWVAAHISYDRRKLETNSTRQWHGFSQFYQSGINYPIQTYYDRSGVCNDFANIAGYALHKAGYTVKIVTAFKYLGARGEDVHTVCAFRDHEKWWVAGDSRNRYKFHVYGPFDSLQEVADHAVGGKATDYFTNRRKGF